MRKFYAKNTPKNTPKSTQKPQFWPKILTLSLYCITLTAICQAFLPILGVNAANANDFYFKNYQVDFYLSKNTPDGSKLRVVEEFTAVFPESDQNHGITRIIPYTNQGGENLTMASDRHLEIKVWHNGQVETPHEVDRGDGYFEVYLGDADTYVHGEQVYKLEYEFINVITEFSAEGKTWQELYWDTNGNDWRQNFESVTANLHFTDTDVQKAFTGDAWCYVGSYGKRGQERCEIYRTPGGLRFSANQLAAGENLTFVAFFDEGTFGLPAPTYNYTGLIILGIELAFTAIILALFWNCYRRSQAKREYYHRIFIKPEYTPPQGFTVAEIAQNHIGQLSLGNSKVATLMELAVQKKIELHKTETPSKFGKPKTTWHVIVKSTDFTPEQLIMLRILAGGKDNIAVDDDITIKTYTATTKLVRLGQKFDRAVQDALGSKGLLALNPKKLSTKIVPANDPSNVPVAIAAFWAFGSLLVDAFLFDYDAPYRPLLGGTSLVICTAVLPWAVFFASIYLSHKIGPFFLKTEKGLEYSKYLDGLKLYIGMAEKERLAFLQSVAGADVSHQGIVKLYEKLLPYAIILNLEKSWLTELSRYYEYDDVGAPTWYHGVGHFSALEFSAAMRAANSTIASNVIHSTTRSSSSNSSGGGGGFSGGGGGGGGGGGW